MLISHFYQKLWKEKTKHTGEWESISDKVGCREEMEVDIEERKRGRVRE